MSFAANGSWCTGAVSLILAGRLDGVCRSTAGKIHQIVVHDRATLTQTLTQWRTPVEDQLGWRLAACASAMAAAFARGARLIAIGAGTSCTDAAALADLLQYPGPGRQALPAVALPGDIAVLTTSSNDITFDVVFERQLAVFGRRGDVVVGLSAAGHRTNLGRAFDRAGQLGLLTVGLLGHEEGEVAETDGIDHAFVVPAGSVHRIQEAHTSIYHTLWELTLNELTIGKRDPARAERREVARGVGDHV